MKSVFVILVFAFALTAVAGEKIIRIGMIGLDTSHCRAFTRIINDSTYEDHIPGAKVVVAYKGGSPDVEASYTRIDKFTNELREKYNVEIVPDIPTLLQKVDAVIITSVDGRVHLEQARPVIAAGKPLFVDKPMAASLKDVKEIFRLANEANVPCFSASSLRFFKELQDVLKDKSLGRVLGCDAYSPASYEPHHPDLFWYGVHGVEILFTAMGPQCTTATRTHTRSTDVVAGVWQDGRIGTFRGTREGAHGYGATIFFEKGIRHVTPGKGSFYKYLVKEIIRFFRTGVSPVDQNETIAMFAFMEAAQKSKEKGGVPVKLSK